MTDIYSTDAYAAIVLEFFWKTMMTVTLIIGIISIVMYVFQAIGLHIIARRRGIKRPWLAWIPLGEYWIIGSISDDYRLLRKGQLHNRRVLVLVLLGVSTIVSLLISLQQYEALYSLWERKDQISIYELETLLSQLPSGTGSGLLDLALSAAEITGLVFYYICLHDLYASCRPGQKVVFLVLSIIFGMTIPFFIFACRYCDQGMQHEKANPWQLPPAPPVWPVQEPPRDNAPTGI